MIFVRLFCEFFKIGLFTFGGGYAMLPLIGDAVVENGWLTKEKLIDFIAVSESTPGPFAINISTYVGTQTAGLSGAFFATLGVVLPSFVTILLVAKFFEKFKSAPIVQGCLSGLKPAVIGLISAAVVSVASEVFFPGGISFDRQFFVSAAIFALVLVPVIKGVHPIAVICISGVLGVAIGGAAGVF